MIDGTTRMLSAEDSSSNASAPKPARVVDVGVRSDFAPGIRQYRAAQWTFAGGHADGCRDGISRRDDPVAAAEPGERPIGVGVRQQIIDRIELSGLHDQALGHPSRIVRRVRSAACCSASRIPDARIRIWESGRPADAGTRLTG
jgi:hypothetical protein